MKHIKLFEGFKVKPSTLSLSSIIDDILKNVKAEFNAIDTEITKHNDGDVDFVLTFNGILDKEDMKNLYDNGLSSAIDEIEKATGLSVSMPDLIGTTRQMHSKERRYKTVTYTIYPGLDRTNVIVFFEPKGGTFSKLGKFFK